MTPDDLAILESWLAPRTDTVEYAAVDRRSLWVELARHVDPFAVGVVVGLLLAVATLIGGSWLLAVSAS